jgi:hypothetical protein
MTNRYSSSLEVSADILLRALAIVLVAYNHAHPFTNFSMGWGGGMTFLMMLSGYNFARFGMEDASPNEGRVALFHLGRKILVPSLIVVIAFFIMLQRFNLEELLFYRNWITTERVSKFPTWYPQVMLQMFAGIFLLFSVPGISNAIFRQPLKSALVIFIFAAAIRAIYPRDWFVSTPHLPHLYLWNFVLGWVVYFSVSRLPSPWGKLLAIACAIIGATASYHWGRLDFWCLLVGVTLLVLPLTVQLWKPIARSIFIISEATFAIFLLHRFVYEVYERMPVPQNEDMKWLAGVVFSVVMWMAGVVPLRAYRALQQRQESRSTFSTELPAGIPSIESATGTKPLMG